MKSLTRFPLLIVLATVLLIDHTSAEPVSPVEEGSEFLRMSLGDWRQVCCPSASYSKCINAKNEGGQLETCVGATGYDCGGVPRIESITIFGTPLVELIQPDSFPLVKDIPGRPGYTSAITSVGSIYHDICCYHNPHGRFCNSGNYPLTSIADGSDEENSCACSIEWRKAVFNLARGRVWRETYSKQLYSSDMTSVSSSATRRAWMPTGLQEYYSYKSNWGLREVKATVSLQAPAMTELDCPYEDENCQIPFLEGSEISYKGGITAGDSEFCKHKKFAAIVTHGYWLQLHRKTRYGICMCKYDSECGSGLTCNDGMCGPSSCSFLDNDCPEGQSCSGGKCVSGFTYSTLGGTARRLGDLIRSIF